MKYRSFGTDFSSLEQELRSESDGQHVPPAYADLTDEVDPDEDDSPGRIGYEDLRKSG